MVSGFECLQSFIPVGISVNTSRAHTFFSHLPRHFCCRESFPIHENCRLMIFRPFIGDEQPNTSKPGILWVVEDCGVHDLLKIYWVSLSFYLSRVSLSFLWVSFTPLLGVPIFQGVSIFVENLLGVPIFLLGVPIFSIFHYSVGVFYSCVFYSFVGCPYLSSLSFFGCPYLSFTPLLGVPIFLFGCPYLSFFLLSFLGVPIFAYLLGVSRMRAIGPWSRKRISAAAP